MFSNVNLVQNLLRFTLIVPMIVAPSLGSNIVAKQITTSSLEASNSVALALVYAYPLTLYVQTFYNTTASVGANTIHRGNTTSTASNPILVRPNADYVYSPVAIDLSHDNVEVTLPNITDRSYVFPFYDLYGDNFANLGSVDNSPPGKYLLRQSDDCEPGLVMGHSEFPQYLGVITSPTTWGSMMIRIVTVNNGTDLQAVLKIESQIDIKPVSRSGSPSGPALTPETLKGSSILNEAALKTPLGLNASDATAILTLMAAIEEYNGPENISDYDAVQEMFRAAGISRGVYTPPPQLNLTLASLIIAKNITAALSTQSNFIQLGNSWENLIPALCGDFHEHYLFRAYTAYAGYLQLVSTQAIYPEYVVNGSNELSVTTNESYVMRFSGKPPAAFWSLTPYADNYLIPNGLNRYSLHEQSNITYPNGSLVYGDDNNTTDGPFEILLQAANVAPPANWTSNWLPAPAGGGSFTVNLRAYGPTAALSNGSYVYPVVTKLSVKV